MAARARFQSVSEVPAHLSVVVPVCNEAAVLPAFHARLEAVLATLDEATTILYVNDGSTDGSLALLHALVGPRVGLLNLSRNFGKEVAVTAGLDHVRADAAVIIDADLQDPPELIPQLVARWHEGYDMVTAQRRVRAGEGVLKRASAHLFYRLIGRIGEVAIPRDTGDFRLLSARAIAAMAGLRERHRMMKGLFAWIGYPAIAVPYDRAPRAAGATKWSAWRLWTLGIEGITGFTTAPLKVATYLGLSVALGAAVFGAQLIARTLLFGNPVPGYASLMTVVLFMGGAQLVTLGVIGEYLGRVFNEAKQRPLYLIEQAILPVAEPHDP